MNSRQAMLGVLAFVTIQSFGPTMIAHAAQVPGNVVTISGLDDVSATVHDQARNGSGKVAAIVLAMVAVGSLITGRMGLALTSAGGAIGMGFMPGAVNSSFTAAQAASFDTALYAGVFEGHWWTPATAALYPGLLAVKALQDPICVLALSAGMLLVAALRRARVVSQ